MLQLLKTLIPVRYAALGLGLCGLLLALASAALWGGGWLAALVVLVCACVVAPGIRDLRLRQHAILRNYPVIGHLRFLLECIRPEIRQYFIESDREAAPFSRAQRAKGEPDNRPFGTQLDVGRQGYEWVNHSMAPTKLPTHDFRVWIGGAPGQPSPAPSPTMPACSTSRP